MKDKKYTSIGGQALIEGVMMRGKDTIAITVRKPDGELETKVEAVSKIEGMKLFKLPVLRGVKALFSSMIVGIRALMFSAEFFEDTDTYEKGKFDLFIERVFKEKANDVLLYVSLVFSIIMALFMFAILPVFVIGLLKDTVENQLMLSMLEGVFKISLFVGYIFLISRMNDVKRVFAYHGAEHKVIHCFESGQELTPENASKFTTLHPRCGTSFMLLVLLISIAVFTFVPWTSLVLRTMYKVLLLPVVAGLSYEVIKVSGKSKNPLVKLISIPGLYLQKLTTNEPDLEQLEVAISSLNLVLENEATDI